MIALQEVYAPGKPLRDKPGMDVRVERNYPPRGAADMEDQLPDYADPFHGLVAFEKRHPFMGGNGRVDHAVWVSLMQAIGRDPFGLGFLHRLYCQVLDAAD